MASAASTDKTIVTAGKAAELFESIRKQSPLANSVLHK